MCWYIQHQATAASPSRIPTATFSKESAIPPSFHSFSLHLVFAFSSNSLQYAEDCALAILTLLPMGRSCHSRWCNSIYDEYNHQLFENNLYSSSSGGNNLQMDKEHKSDVTIDNHDGEVEEKRGIARW